MTTRDAILQVHFKAGDYRSIWVNTRQGDGGAVDNKTIPNIGDLRTFRDNPREFRVMYRSNMKTNSNTIHEEDAEL